MLRVRSIDRLFIITLIFLVLGGVAMVYSTSYVVAMKKFGGEFFFVKKQLLFALAGLAVFLVFSKIPYEVYRRLTYPLLASSAILLLLVLVPGLGHSAGGARRWLDFGFTFQPSEVAKLTTVVFLAYSLEAKKDVIKTFALGFLPNMIIPLAIIALIMAEPDFGTAITLAMAVYIMNFIGGVRVGYLASSVVMALPFVYVVITNFSYMARRLVIFLDPWADPDGAGFQIIQSFIAFGSGGIWGVGPGQGRQKLFFLPEAHTDFIFSIIGEEFGLVGVGVTVGLFVLFLISGIRIAMRAKDLFGAYLCLGLTFMITLQALVNMAVVLGLVPPKGLPLPFISYGGSSLMVSMVSAGMIYNVYIKGNEG